MPSVGRPKTDNPLRKRFFRCTDEDWERLAEAAKKAKATRSDLIRAGIEDQIGKYLAEKDE